MRFDLFYELSVPAFAERSERQVYHDTLEELAWADRLGFHTAWLVEHHFMPEYSHSSSPALYLAAASQRTERLRLGHAIVPLPYSHPIRIAEQLATLDVLSQGRLEFGFGRGFSPREYACFGIPMGDSRAVTEEALAIIRQSFAGQPFAHQGRHFQFDTLEVLPKVVQQPHPPLWTAAVSPESYDLAAKLGVGVLAGPFKPWFMVREDIKRYRRAWQQRHGDAALAPGQNNRAAMTIGIYCHEDMDTARREAKAAFEWFYRALLDQTLPVLKKLHEGYEYYRKMGHFNRLFPSVINLKVLETLGMAVVGDPAHCVDKLHKLKAAGVDHVMCAVGAGAMPSERVRRSMALIAERVMPALQ